MKNLKRSRLLFTTILFASFPLFIGCQSEVIEEPAPVVNQDPMEGYIKVMLDQRSLHSNGVTWRVGMDDIRNILIHDNEDNADGTFTTNVSFESAQDSGIMAIDATIHYKINEMEIDGGHKIASYPVISVNTTSIKPIKS